MPDDAGIANEEEPEIQVAGTPTECQHCPSPAECHCPQTPKICREGACKCGPECPCPAVIPPYWPPGWPPWRKHCRARKRRRQRRRVLGGGPSAGAGGCGGRGLLLIGGGLLFVALVVIGIVVLRSDDDGDTTAPPATTTTTTTAADETSDVPPLSTADIETILDSLGITDPVIRQGVLDSMLPVDGVEVGQGAVPLGEVPGSVVPLYHGEADVTRAGEDYVAFVTQVEAPVDMLGVQWGLGYAREGAPLSQPATDPVDFFATFPHSAFYFFDAAAGTGDLTQLDPVNGFAEVQTTAMWAGLNDILVFLIPRPELEPGGQYAIQGFFRETPEGQSPSDTDPTGWTSWVGMLDY